MIACCKPEGRQCCRTLVPYGCIVSLPCGRGFADRSRMILSTGPRPSSHHTGNHSLCSYREMMMLLDRYQCCKVEILECQCNYRHHCLMSHFVDEFEFHHRKIASTVSSLANHCRRNLRDLNNRYLRGNLDLHFRRYHTQYY